jgi:hypothetical protein
MMQIVATPGHTEGGMNAPNEMKRSVGVRKVIPLNEIFSIVFKPLE